METPGKSWDIGRRLKGLVITHFFLAVIFITTGAMIDIIQGLMYITIFQINPQLYRKINCYVTYMLNSQIVFLVEWWSGSTTVVFTDPENGKKYFGKEHAFLLLNHCYETDWLLGWTICDRAGVLGNAKVFVKKMLKYAPILGWSWRFQEIVFLERDWEKDKITLVPQLKRLCTYPDPMWLTLFPEGTRFTEEKHKASMEVARKKGLPPLKHHLLPRTRGFTGSIPHVRDTIPAIYDIVIAFDKSNGIEPTVYTMLCGYPLHAHLCIRRIPMEEVPEDETEMAAWLQKLYQQKDKLLDNFINTGNFLSDDIKDDYPNYRYVENVPRRIYPLLNFVCWAILILTPLNMYIYSMLTSGSYANIIFVVIFVGAAWYGLSVLVSMTQTNTNASSYGKVEGSSHSSNGTSNLNASEDTAAKSKVQ